MDFGKEALYLKGLLQKRWSDYCNRENILSVRPVSISKVSQQMASLLQEGVDKAIGRTGCV